MAISDKLQELLDIKQDIKVALENNGVDLTDVDFSGYAEKIGEIQTGGGSVNYKSLSFNDIKVLSWRSYGNSASNRYYLKPGTRTVTKSAATLLYYGNPFTMQFQLLPSGTYDLVIPGLPQITASINYNAGVGWTETWTNTSNYWAEYQKPAIQIVVDSTNHYLVADAVINKDTTTASSNFGTSGFQIISYSSNSDNTTINSIGNPNNSGLYSSLINSASSYNYPVDKDISLTRVHLVVLGGATSQTSSSIYVLSLSTWSPNESTYGQMWIVTPT